MGSQLPNFLALSETDRRGIYTTLSPQLGMTPEILEKDVWVCWTLDALFTIENGKKMAFKGGTSLSKAYEAISRFSEDIDITVAHDSLDPTIDPFAPGLSRNAVKRMSETLNEALYVYVRNEVEPHFRSLLSEQFSRESWALDIVSDGEELRLTYPSVTEHKDEIDPNYIKEYVKVEFGGRNATDPIETHLIVPYLQGHVDTVSMPEATTKVLSGTRTFWEKATLAHVECHRPEVRANANRMSRHWYDLYKLANSSIGTRALEDRKLLEDVVKYKTLLYNSGYANYDKCLDGNLRLIPDKQGLLALKDDYGKMQEKAMLYGEIPTFEEIIERLSTLETEINA